MKQLIRTYQTKKEIIKARLSEFARNKRAPENKIFSELCFCLLTPQSKAVSCDKAIKRLNSEGLLIGGCQSKISSAIRGLVRFHNNKSKYIVESREKLLNSKGGPLKNLLEMPPYEARQWLVKNIKGMSFKEAGHFLRNIGKGEGLAIIDRHILANLKKYGVIKDMPKTLTPRVYVEIEQKMKRFSAKAKIPLEELDLLFWSEQTGYVFK